jgi:tRNA A-37 threonylcarbamoyl transferase component Bud32
MPPATRGDAPTVLADASAGGDSAALPPGTRAGDYVIEGPLGAGGMGEVYAGRHPLIGKRVAIKVLRRELASRPASAERFLREARAVNQIDHPNVVDVFAVGRLDDGRLYLVMDLLDGQSLRARLQAGVVPTAVALDLLGQIAAAIDAAHAKGVIHRDLKPDNVMLTGPADRPTAHVLDFGIAKLVADAAGDEVATLTGQGAWLGTPAYMAPEQWTADGAVAASDRYALAVVAFELLTGRPPFAASSLPAMMEQHFRAAVPSVATAAGRVLSAGLDEVFARGLAKDPAARPPSARALVEELSAASTGGAVAPRAASRRWMAAAGTAVALGAGAILVVGAGRDRDESPRRPSPPPAVGGAIVVTTEPAGAEVRRAGQRIGETPVRLTAAPGEAVELELAAPGCVAIARTVQAAPDREIAVHVPLARADGFAGIWRLPEGELRSFERQGEQVLAFRLRSPTERREFLRAFTFAPGPLGAVVFAASEPFIAEEAPEEPSCHIPLRAEYAYQPRGDRLEVRRERARVAVADGRCTLTATAWSDWKALARVAPDQDGEWTESRAGGARVVAATGNGDAPIGKEPVGKEPVGKEPVGKPPVGKPPPDAKRRAAAKVGAAGADEPGPPPQQLAPAPQPTTNPPVVPVQPAAPNQAPAASQQQAPTQQQAPIPTKGGAASQAQPQGQTTLPTAAQ